MWFNHPDDFFESVKPHFIKHTCSRKDLFCSFLQCLDDKIQGKQHPIKKFNDNSTRCSKFRVIYGLLYMNLKL